MTKQFCCKCGSNNILICRTLNNEIIYILCRTCKFEDIRNKDLWGEMQDFYDKHKGVKK